MGEGAGFAAEPSSSRRRSIGFSKARALVLRCGLMFAVTTTVTATFIIRCEIAADAATAVTRSPSSARPRRAGRPAGTSIAALVEARGWPASIIIIIFT